MIENVLYPYHDNESAMGNCFKLMASDFAERKAVVIIGYEHKPPTIEVETAINAFEARGDRVHSIPLGFGREARVEELIHLEYQQVPVGAREVAPSSSRAAQFT